MGCSTQEISVVRRSFVLFSFRLLVLAFRHFFPLISLSCGTPRCYFDCTNENFRHGLHKPLRKPARQSSVPGGVCCVCVFDFTVVLVTTIFFGFVFAADAGPGQRGDFHQGVHRQLRQGQASPKAQQALHRVPIPGGASRAAEESHGGFISIIGAPPPKRNPNPIPNRFSVSVSFFVLHRGVSFIFCLVLSLLLRHLPLPCLPSSLVSLCCGTYIDFS